MRCRKTANCVVFLVVLILLIGFINSSFSTAQSSDQANKFEEYRTAIKKAYGMDIKNFKDRIKGGKADGKPITKYDLQQLIMGINVEQEHTSDKMRALEISTDHLDEFPDYYSRLAKMEEEAEKEMEQKAKK